MHFLSYLKPEFLFFKIHIPVCVIKLWSFPVWSTRLVPDICGLQWNIILWEWILGFMHVTIILLFTSFSQYKSCNATNAQKEGWRCLRAPKCRVKVQFTLQKLLDAKVIVFVEFLGQGDVKRGYPSTPLHNIFDYHSYNIDKYCDANLFLIKIIRPLVSCTTQQWYF